MRPEYLALMIPITAIVLGVGVAFWSIYWDHQKKRLQYQERQLMIEKGLTPTPVLLEERKKVTPEDCLRRGTILLFLGIGFAAASLVVFNVADEEDLAWVLGVAAAIVGFLGLGYLTYYFIARRNPQEPARNSELTM